MTDHAPPKLVGDYAVAVLPAPQERVPGAVLIPLYRMTDLPHGFKPSDQDRRKP